jgi:hypothetical protein
MKRLALALIALACLYSTNVEARGHRGLPWCGIYMGKYFGMSDRSLWIARNWSRVGSNAGGPGQGVVVVWPHHVGVITGQASNGEWIVHSGNDGGAVRTRPRSLRGVIAFRHVGGSGSAYADLKVQEQTTRSHSRRLVALATPHDGFRTGFSRQAAARPNSQASLQWGWNTPPDTQWQGMFAHAPDVGGAAAKRAYRHRAR